MSLSPETIASLFDMSSDPVLGIDKQKNIAFINPPAAALLGARAGESADGIIPGHVLDASAERFITSMQVNGRRANASVVRMDGIAVCTVFLLEADMPAVRKSSPVLQEMSSRLMNVRMALDALVKRTKAEEQDDLKELSQTLYREYFRMQRLCKHLKIAAGIMQDDMPLFSQVTDLGKLCREVCDSVSYFSERYGISVLFDADFGVHLTMADSGLLELMVLNLLTNSILHAKRGDVLRVKLTQEDDRFIISIQDPGSGISPDRMAAIFSGAAVEDMSDSTVGAGLGVFLARGIAECHGGHMVMESRPDRGTSVRISIPIRQSEELKINTPVTRYRSDGMNNVLMELSVWLDKKYYTHKMFD